MGSGTDGLCGVRREERRRGKEPRCTLLYNICVHTNTVFVFSPSFQHFPEWNWEEREIGVGSPAMGGAVFMGVDKRPVVDALVKAGAELGYYCDNGSNILTNMAANVVSNDIFHIKTAIYHPHVAHSFSIMFTS